MRAWGAVPEDQGGGRTVGGRGVHRRARPRAVWKPLEEGKHIRRHSRALPGPASVSAPCLPELPAASPHPPPQEGGGMRGTAARKQNHAHRSMPAAAAAARARGGGAAATCRHEKARLYRRGH